MKVLDYEKIIDIFKKKKYVWFTKPYDLNIFGIRSKNQVPDTFDDIIGCFWTDEKNNKNLYYFDATTDPGKYYLNNPINVKGTGILAPGQYRGMWKRGLHKGKPALVQVGKCVAIRDFNRDNLLDFSSARRETGLFGCNLHRANVGRVTKVVGKWSAMCQIPADDKNEDFILSLADKQVKYTKVDLFTYTLLEEDDLI